MKLYAKLSLLILGAAALLLAGCSGPDYGVIELSVTDAPIIDEDSITGVYVTFEDVQYNNGSGWESMTGFEGPQTHDLLDLTRGESALLGQLSLPAGTYEQIRFIVAAQSEGGAMPTNAGTWINRDSNSTYDEGTDDPLFMPSGAQTGYKATADEPFTIPANGSVSMTADFDLRRAVVRLGTTGNYLIKPVIRLVVDNQAGTIAGNVTNNTTDENDLVVYAYEAGTFDAAEADTPADGESQYPNAVSSSSVEDTDSDGNLDYALAFLAEGSYDLVIAQYDSSTGAYVDGSGDAVDESGIAVSAGQTTTQALTE